MGVGDVRESFIRTYIYYGKPLLKGWKLGIRPTYKGVTYYPCFRGFDRDNYYTENKDNNFKRKLSFI